MKKFILMILLNASVGYATDYDCANALLTSSAVNPAAQSYVELIAHFRKKSSDETTPRLILHSILKSKRILNPFANRQKDPRFSNSLAIQVSEAIERVTPSIQAHEWRVIQSDLKSLWSGWDQQEADRAQKSNQTRAIFKPQLKEGLCGPVTSKASNVQAPLNKGESRYMVSVDYDSLTYMLYLIECVNEVQIIRDKIPLTEKLYDIRWNQVGDRDILLAHGNRGHPMTFELNNQKLNKLEIPRSSVSQNQVLSFSDLAHFDNRDFLVTGGYNRIMLWELLEDQWVWVPLKIDEIFNDMYLNQPYPTTHLRKIVVGERLFYLAAFPKAYAMFELKDGELKLLFGQKLLKNLGLYKHPPAIQIGDNRITFTFIANNTGGGRKGVFVDFDLSSGRHTYHTVRRKIFKTDKKAQWVQGEPNTLALLSMSRHGDIIEMFRWNGQKMIVHQTVNLNDYDADQFESFGYMDRSFITYVSKDKDFVILEKINNVWTEIGRVHVPSVVSNYQLIIDQDRVYATVEDHRGDYRLIDLIYSQRSETK